MASSRGQIPVKSGVVVTTTEMHTGGEPVRILEAGYPVPQGATVTEKMAYLKERCEDFRKFVLWEPRGHYDMYGVLFVAPDDPKADAAVIFLNNGGYATMCGHVTLAIARYIVDRGLLKSPIVSPETTVRVQTAAGVFDAFVDVRDEDGIITTGKTRFENVASFVVTTDLNVPVAGLGNVQLDVVYGGVFYAVVAASDIGVNFGETPDSEIKRRATTVKEATIPLVQLSHPTCAAYIYGVLIVDSRHTLDPVASTTLCIFADASTDRSPCGTGTASLATLQYHRGLLALGQSQRYRNGVTWSEFTARPIKEVEVGDFKGITVMVEGQAHYCGRSTMTLEEGDKLGRGFLVR